jgi:acetylglutamate kinase
VVSSLAADPEGHVLNVNADTLAAVLAGGLGAQKLIYMTGAPGLLREADDPSSLVAFAAPEDLKVMLAEGSVKGGMRPKVEACLKAVSGGVRRTHIIDGRTPDALLLELFTGHGSGTMIVGEREKRSYETAGR